MCLVLLLCQTMALVDWKTAITSSQDAAIAEEDLTRVMKFYNDAGFKLPTEVVGLVKEDLVNGTHNVQWPSLPKQLAITRKVLVHVNAVDAAERAVRKRKAMILESKDRSLEQELSDNKDMNLRVTGSETSALDLAKAMVTDDVKKVDAETKLKEKGYGSLPFHLKGDMAAFHILWAATVAAKTAARSVYFIYVNLAAQEFLLNWMPRDTVGGRDAHGEDDHIASLSLSSLRDLHRCLRGAFTEKRWFRTKEQWIAVWTWRSPLSNLRRRLAYNISTP